MIESRGPTWLRWLKTILILLGILVLISLLAADIFTTTAFLAASLGWLAGCVFALPPPDVNEIAFGALRIRRNVQTAQQIRDQVEHLAQNVSEASDRVHRAELQIGDQQKVLMEVSSRIDEASRSVSSTVVDLRGMAEALVEALYLSMGTHHSSTISTADVDRLRLRLGQLAHFARRDDAAREKWLEDFATARGRPPKEISDWLG
jgi:methyl-accepting chemotaxis protein